MILQVIFFVFIPDNNKQWEAYRWLQYVNFFFCELENKSFQRFKLLTIWTDKSREKRQLLFDFKLSLPALNWVLQVHVKIRNLFLGDKQLYLSLKS